MSPSLPSPSERLHGLDAVRAGALLLGLVVHASMSLLPGAQLFWPVHDSRPAAALGLAFYVPHMFRMLLFFLLAGFFGRMLLQRRGLAGFVRDRLRRIALPLMAGWPLVFGALVAVMVWAAVRANGGALPAQAPPGPAFTPDSFPLTHLWFLYVLLLCYAAMLLMRAVGAGLGRVVRLPDPSALTAALAGPAGPLLLALPLALALCVHPGWVAWFGIPTPDQSLYPSLAAWCGFGVSFAFGWGLQRCPQRLQAWARHWPLHLSLALAATCASLALVGLSPRFAPLPSGGHTLAYAACYALGAWSWTFALVGLGLRFLSGASVRRRGVADASYWLYLVHLPLIMALQVLMAPLAWPAALKLLTLVSATAALGLGSWRWWVRGRFLGRMLGGEPSVPAPAPPALAPPAAPMS